MKSKNAFYMMIGVVVLLAGINLAALFIGRSLLKTRSDKLLSLKVDDEVLNDQQQALAQARKDLTKYTDLANVAKSIVPQDKDQAQTVREIYSIAAKHRIGLQSITFPTSNLGQSAASSQSSTSATVPTASTKPTVSQVVPAPGL